MFLDEQRKAMCVSCREVGRIADGPLGWFALPLHSLDGEREEEVFYIHRKCASLHRAGELIAVVKDDASAILASPDVGAGPVVSLEEARKANLLKAFAHAVKDIPDL